jgi:hypothetical protein
MRVQQGAGFGFAESVTSSLIHRVVEFYRDEGNGHAVIQIGSSVLPADWRSLSERQSLRPGTPCPCIHPTRAQGGVGA